ncbi:hypothetical protein BCR32DRAFT_324573 [Anaeromyces robustus]|uniref:Dickkopf N-terminal cysteine-rich domain-containing protein n=1 Tax=Anaeromyces robustus TaxID=1754192 RepID=A0A1Y1XNX6_9FUNG|nr:hypothetical protein BCR32DRAFT_324573 [Anaeromyces robustus]|eukprot:ORX87226.1 hypothetical protein BCR32DRAFT_324573 [Anaeromyces robustus]
MFVKNPLFYLLLNLTVYINLIKSESNFYSNYTLSSLSKFEQKKTSCKNNTECMNDTSCNFFENDNLCVLGTYLCKEDENTKCIFIGTKEYNNDIDEIKYNNDSEKLILKSCDKVNVDAKKCETERCTKDTDCFSGVCYSNSCIAEKPIYVCSDISVNDEKMGMNCKKQNQMKFKFRLLFR